jgi:Ca2+-binding RTX toxin-like protein
VSFTRIEASAARHLAEENAMATYSYTNDVVVTAASDNAVDIIAGDIVYVAQGVNISASGFAADGIHGPDHARITISGDVFGETGGINVNGMLGDSTITITSTGAVTGGDFGIGAGGSNNEVYNAGTVVGFFGISLTNGGYVNNSGLIQSDLMAVRQAGAASTSTQLVNSGEIISSRFAYVGDKSADTVLNTGQITGLMVFANGNDLLDSRGGIIVGKVDLGDGNDTAFGGDAADDIFGDLGSDLIRGRLGDDKLDGGLAKDKLFGGSGEDDFLFTSALGGDNVDRIGDFSHADDTIGLDDAVFAALGATVGKGEFLSRSSGHTATRASHHLIYDEGRGTLWYDADGKGGAAAIKFAVLQDHPTNLNFHDFAIV